MRSIYCDSIEAGPKCSISKKMRNYSLEEEILTKHVAKATPTVVKARGVSLFVILLHSILYSGFPLRPICFTDIVKKFQTNIKYSYLFNSISLFKTYDVIIQITLKPI